jgi:hypothetical protein
MLAPLLAGLLVLGALPDAPLPDPGDAPVQRPTDAPVVPPAAVTQLPPAPPVRTERAARIAIELLVSGAAGLGVGAFGGYIGCVASESPDGQSCSTGTIAAVGLTGYGLTIAAMVPLVGNALGGGGLAWVSWLGEAVGLGGGLALAQGNPRTAMFIAAPLMLVGAITGYELSAGPDPRRQPPVVQAVTVVPLPDGAVLAVAGRF